MEMRFCFIGDSFTHGVGDMEALGWRGRVIRRMLSVNTQITAYDLGVRHETSSDILKRWEGEARARFMKGTAHRLAFCFSSNDCADNGAGGPRVDPSVTVRNSQQILTMARTMAPSILIGPPPLAADAAANARIQTMEHKLESVAEAHGVPFLPMFDFLSANEIWTKSALSGDGVHPDGAGYGEMAQRIWDWPAFQSWSMAY